MVKRDRRERSDVATLRGSIAPPGGKNAFVTPNALSPPRRGNRSRLLSTSPTTRRRGRESAYEARDTAERFAQRTPARSKNAGILLARASFLSPPSIFISFLSFFFFLLFFPRLSSSRRRLSLLSRKVSPQSARDVRARSNVETIGNFFNLRSANEQMLSRRRFPDLTRRVKSRRRGDAVEGMRGNARLSCLQRHLYPLISLYPSPLSLSLISPSLAVAFVLDTVAPSGIPTSRVRRNDESVEISFRMPRKRRSTRRKVE